MSGECDDCGERTFECTCDKKEKHEAFMQKRRELIRRELQKLFKRNVDCADFETEVED